MLGLRWRGRDFILELWICVVLVGEWARDIRVVVMSELMLGFFWAGMEVEFVCR